ncbi:MAG: hypothetical protein Q9160_005039 [Pyrenula sp. 1 TL-2023]
MPRIGSLSFRVPSHRKKPKTESILTLILQALLSRHESYMQDSEKERDRLTLDIEKVESEKKTLEDENQRVVAENRELLNQLEDLNDNIADSDARVKSLAASLASAQYEIRRLNSLAARASHLETELQSLESDQAQLRKDLETCQETERSSLSRWRQAECKVRDLSDQLERIEREASEEREKHVELLGRIERRRTVEKELETAAGRLKGAAAATSLARNKAGTNVVSHFVRDILLDNSTLQAGIDELRDMLRASNEEVENLREQVILHQPFSGLLDEYDPANRLNEELDQTGPGSLSQEVHVHHHYHNVPSRMTPRRDKAILPRRPKKRSPPSLMTPPQRGRPIRPSLSRLSNYSAPSVAIDEESSSSHGATPISSKRWSIQSSSTAPTTVISSMPSSPRSWRRNSSIFDRIEEGIGSSRPTSPESLGYASPIFGKSHNRSASDVSLGWRSNTPDLPVTGAATMSSDGLSSPAIMESKTANLNDRLEGNESLSVDESTKICASPFRLPKPDESYFSASFKPIEPLSELESMSRPSLRRISSSDSVRSVSGMDIHTLRKRPSIATFAPSSGSSKQTSAMVSSAQAVSANVSVSSKSSQALLSDLNRSRHPPEGFGLSRWVKGKWGIAPMLSTGNLRARIGVGEETRAPGINQKGFIAGLRPPVRTPSTVVVDKVNDDLLKESLGE